MATRDNKQDDEAARAAAAKAGGHRAEPEGPGLVGVMEPEPFVNPEVPGWATERWGEDSEEYPALRAWAKDEGREDELDSPHRVPTALIRDWEAARAEKNAEEKDEDRARRKQ